MKNREAFELIGIVSVVISLVFVGYEIRQSTNVARSDAYQQFNLAASQFNMSVANNEHLRRIADSYDQAATIELLSMSDQLTVSSYYNSLLRLWTGLYYSVQEGVLPEDALMGVGRGGAFTQPFFIPFWQTIKASFDADYVEFIESRIDEVRNQVN